MLAPPPPVLIQTKLLVPPLRPKRVERSRITAWLNEALGCPLVLVSSLPGSGKTTALVEWVNQLDLPAAWLSLDEGDNDLTRFLTYFAAAVQRVVPGAGAAGLEFLRSSESAPVENVAAALINGLAQARGEFVLVLDDYHVIQSPAVHQALALLVEHQPAQLRLVIATRSDPILPLARLRAQGRVVELRMEQLRFTSGETADYLNRLMGLGLSAEDLSTLLARTEGWIASLQMAALSLKNNPDGKAFIQAFSGSQRFILDYLVEEVLNRQPESVQSFLLQTCVLERLCAPLCDALTGSPSQAMLETLERSNLFIVPLDEERRWYRYHHLFAGLLRARLAHTPASQDQAELHRRAAGWYEDNGFLEEAIHHAMAAGDHPLAARLVECAAESLWLSGKNSHLHGWIQALPAELARSRPWLCVWSAWSFTLTGILPEARRWTAAAEQAAESQAQELPLADLQGLREQIAALRVLIASLAEDYPRTVELAGPALANPPAGHSASSLLARCNILHALSSLYYPAGELERTEQTCLETMRIAREAGFLLRYLHAANKLANTYITSGQLRRCLQLLEETLDFLQGQNSQDYYAAGQVYCRWSDLLYEWDQLDETGRTVQKSFALNERVQMPYLLVDSLALQARFLITRGDYAAAQEALDRSALQIRRSYIWPALVWQHETAQVRLWLAIGDLARAAAWAGAHASAPADPLPFSQEAAGISCARIRLAQGLAGEAVGSLERLAASARAGGRYGRLVEIRALQALARQSAGDTSGALDALREALALGEAGGYLRTFLEGGRPMAALLSRLAGEKASPHQAYARLLLAGWEGRARQRDVPSQNLEPPQARPAPHYELVEPLTGRELEVLRCMDAGLSNGEIALRLVIALSTVKRHVNHIFDKLGVQTRTRALAKAREAGLI